MSKRVIKFKNPRFWETSPTCVLCPNIDKLYQNAINSNNEDYKVKTLIFLDNNYLVNGYNLVPVLEQNGYLGNKSKIELINNYTSIRGEYTGDLNNQDEYNRFLDKPRLIHSRWCKYCGSRKPDIYDESREINE